MAERGVELQLRTAPETVQNNREVLALFASIEDQLRVCPFIGETHRLVYAWNNNRLVSPSFIIAVVVLNVRNGITCARLQDVCSTLERSRSNALKYASSLEGA